MEKENCSTCLHYDIAEEWNGLCAEDYPICLKGRCNLKGFPFSKKAKCWESEYSEID